MKTKKGRTKNYKKATKLTRSVCGIRRKKAPRRKKKVKQGNGNAIEQLANYSLELVLIERCYRRYKADRQLRKVRERRRTNTCVRVYVCDFYF